ncbi:hypothetical protein E0E02_09250 [Streptococcus sp. KCJ4932]|nr:hypothetical protein E0E02_09250 [Streptococcus sp. KCJ4932]
MNGFFYSKRFYPIIQKFRACKNQNAILVN